MSRSNTGIKWQFDHASGSFHTWNSIEGAACIHDGCREESLGMGGTQRLCEEPEGMASLSKTTRARLLFIHYPQAHVQGLVDSKCSKIFAE